MEIASQVADGRIRALNVVPPNAHGRYVLYWMIASRRTTWNFSLQRAADWARALGCGLIIFEALRVDYPWASDRLHRFVLDGMAERAAALQGRHGVAYYPYVEPAPGAGRGLFESLARSAAVVITDDYPTFFLPGMLAAVSSRVPVRFEAIDGNGLLPMRDTDTVYPSAYAFRRYLQRRLPATLPLAPVPDPLTQLTGASPLLPAETRERWPDTTDSLGQGGPDLATLPIDHGVAVVPQSGGTLAARQLLARFIERGLPRYTADRNQPEEEVASGLSAHLHFGHISVHEVFDCLASHEGWEPDQEPRKATGKREGWWGMSPEAEGFLDQLVTWRELGFNMAVLRPDHREYDSLPDWARRTLEEHAGDERSHLYALEQLESAGTHDELWNAAQTQLRLEGRIHNYLRMLWGKKVLEWTPHPREAARAMIELNNRYALDGRDPNSYSGIYWCLGRYDRPWGPERAVFGKIRYMSSGNTARKVRVRGYVERYSTGAA